MIDTTGAWGLRNYMSQGTGSAYNISFGRKGAFKLYTPVNGNLVIGSVFGRDQISLGGNPDSTTFTSLPGFGSSKNGMNPRYWKSEPSNSVPGKSDLIEAYTAFRR